jgi:hypothetical protein
MTIYFLSTYGLTLNTISKYDVCFLEEWKKEKNIIPMSINSWII